MFQFKLWIRIPRYQTKASLDVSLGWRGCLFSGSMENVEVRARQGAYSGLGGYKSDNQLRTAELELFQKSKRNTELSKAPEITTTAATFSWLHFYLNLVYCALVKLPTLKIHVRNWLVSPVLINNSDSMIYYCWVY